jgi:hypothetical protein
MSYSANLLKIGVETNDAGKNGEPKIISEKYCLLKALTLTLLVPRIRADDPDHALAAHDLALAADLLD